MFFFDQIENFEPIIDSGLWFHQDVFSLCLPLEHKDLRGRKPAAAVHQEFGSLKV